MGVMATIGRPKFKDSSAPGAVRPSSAQEAGRDLPADKWSIYLSLYYVLYAYVCMYVCMYIFMYVCMYVYVSVV